MFCLFVSRVHLPGPLSLFVDLPFSDEMLLDFHTSQAAKNHAAAAIVRQSPKDASVGLPIMVHHLGEHHNAIVNV